ncbi:MAG: ABC-2 transporter permease, partial [Cellulosilyticaceae bacterium]
PVRDFILQNKLSMIASLCSSGLIYVSIILPLLFKFGTEKTRILMLVLYGGAFALMPLFSKLLNLDTMNVVLSRLTPFVILFICICIYLISMVISSSIWEKKEY